MWRATEEPNFAQDEKIWEILDKLVIEQQAQTERTWEFQEALTPSERRKAEVVRNLYKPLTAKRVARAANSFKERTTRIGGIHPRHAGWLGHQLVDEANEAMACYLREVENTGIFGAQDRMLAVLLLIKPTGGRRPISQFASLYRVWGKARKHDLAEWELEMLHDELFNTGQKRRTTDAVWRAEMRAEAAKKGGHEYLMLLWDLKQAFDLVGHEKLIAEAKELQAPLKILRVLVAAYRWARYLMLDGMLSQPLWPQNGVAAGCWGALTALKVHLGRTLRRQEHDYVRVMLTINVDDLLQEIEGEDAEEIVAIAKQAASHLLFRLTLLGM